MTKIILACFLRHGVYWSNRFYRIAHLYRPPAVWSRIAWYLRQGPQHAYISIIFRLAWTIYALQVRRLWSTCDMDRLVGCVTVWLCPFQVLDTLQSVQTAGEGGGVPTRIANRWLFSETGQVYPFDAHW